MSDENDDFDWAKGSDFDDSNNFDNKPGMERESLLEPYAPPKPWSEMERIKWSLTEK